MIYCDSCLPGAVHRYCIGLDKAFDDEWFCAACASQDEHARDVRRRLRESISEAAEAYFRFEKASFSAAPPRNDAH